MALAYSLSLPASKLAFLLRSLEASFDQAILESVVDICFVSVARPPDDFHFNPDFDPKQWEKGRAFGEQMELRWRRRGSEFAVLIISESHLTLPAEVQGEMEKLPDPLQLSHVDRDQPLRAVLWGEWQAPHIEPDLPDPDRRWWYEERIPRFLGYPWRANDQHLAVEIARYRAPSQTEEEDFPGDFIYRFVRLVSVTIPSEEAPSVEEEEKLKEEEDDDQPI